MRITRLFTEAGRSPYDGMEFRKATSEIRNPDGSIVFESRDFEAPAAWSQVACDILAQKYFRKAGVPAEDDLEAVPEGGVPGWLWRRTRRVSPARIRGRCRRHFGRLGWAIGTSVAVHYPGRFSSSRTNPKAR